MRFLQQEILLQEASEVFPPQSVTVTLTEGLQIIVVISTQCCHLPYMGLLITFANVLLFVRLF